MGRKNADRSNRPRKSKRSAKKKNTAREKRIEMQLDHLEFASLVMKYLCKGYTVAETLEEIRERYPDMPILRQDPYEILREMGRRGYVSWEPPRSAALRNELMRLNPGLSNVEVVHTTTVQDVARQTAGELLRMVQGLHRQKGLDEVHIGFAGGHSMRAVARCFADELCTRGEALPKQIVFHALAAGFDRGDPTTDPNAFFLYFLDRPLMQVEPRFVGLSAPSMVGPEMLDALKELDDIKSACGEVKNIDIFVTSGTDWNDDHSALYRRMSKSKASVATLKEAGCVGDILWRPVGTDGPIEVDTDLRALTLVELRQLSTYIRKDKQVLLMLAPCGGCNRPKGALLKCLLEQARPIVTRIVVDSRTANQLLGMTERGAA